MAAPLVRWRCVRVLLQPSTHQIQPLGARERGREKLSRERCRKAPGELAVSTATHAAAAAAARGGTLASGSAGCEARVGQRREERMRGVH